MAAFTFMPVSSDLLPLDLDVHAIPARREEPLHLHWDVRFLLQAAAGQSLVVSPESNDLRWVPVGRLPEFTAEASVLRLHDKTVQRLRR